MSTEAPKPVGGDDLTLTMNLSRHETMPATVIPMDAAGSLHAITELAVNDLGDVHDQQRPPALTPPRARPRLPAPRAAAHALSITDRSQNATPAMADAIDPLQTERILASAASILSVDAAEMPRLMASLRGSLVSRNASLDILLSEAEKLGIVPAHAIAILIATSLPERFASVAELSHRPPHGQAQVALSMYVTALLSDELVRSMPPREALRMAAIASGRLTRLAPEDILLVSRAIPRFVEGMGRAGRIEASTAVAALVHTAPEALARVTRENRDTRLLIEARAIAERWHDPNEPDDRGLAIAAAFVLLANTPSPDVARAVFERATRTVDGAAPRIILSCANDDERDDDLGERVTRTLDRLEPFLAKYESLRAELVTVNMVPRAELCTALHQQLTRGSEQFYMALLSLLRRHQTFATRPGTRALRTALEDRDTWDRLAVA